MKRISRAIAIGAITIGMAAGAAAPAQATGLCSADWGGVHMPCKMF